MIHADYVADNIGVMKKKIILPAAIACLVLQSCYVGDYKAQEEIEYLQRKLDKINSIAEKTSDIISNFPEDNEDAIKAWSLIEEIKEESTYRDYDFSYPE